MPWFLRNYVNQWKSIADFQGRTSLRDAWLFQVTTLLFSLLWPVAMAFGVLLDLPSWMQPSKQMVTNLYLLWLFGSILVCIPMSVRRLHDQGRSGWWVLVPIANIALVWVVPGQPVANGFGSSPGGAMVSSN